MNDETVVSCKEFRTETGHSYIIIINFMCLFVPIQANPAGLLGLFAPLDFLLRTNIIGHCALSGFSLASTRFIHAHCAHKKSLKK